MSHAVVTTRWIRPGDHHRLRTAYVDAVATLRDRQRRGYGSAVIRQLASDLGDDDIACLDTPQPRRSRHRSGIIAACAALPSPSA